MTSIQSCRDRLGAYYLRGYLQGALQKGYDPEAILKQAGIPPGIYHDAGATVSGEQLQHLILTIREVLNDHYMGFLQVPGKLAMDAESGRAAVKGETLGEGIRLLVEFINAVRSDEERECILDEGSGEFSLVYRFSGFNPGVDPHLLYSFRMHWGYKFYCWLTGQRIKLTRVCFSAPDPAHGIDYKEVFDCAVAFEQPDDRFCFDQQYLITPVIRNEVELVSGDFPRNYPDWFTIPGREHSVTSQVERILIALHREGSHSPPIAVVADRLSLSVRTLCRKLSKEKASYQKVKGRVRCELAKQFLLQSDVSVSHIAGKIGFSEPGDFTRAFVGWTGQTPSSYRAERGIRRISL